VTQTQKLQQLVTIANRVAVEFNEGSRDTCILTSFALHNVLQWLGCNSRPLRIDAAVSPDDRSSAERFLAAIPWLHRAVSPHPRQVGFAHAGDARPSHGRPLADRIFQACSASGNVSSIER
jgi:hypothetical protein